MRYSITRITIHSILPTLDYEPVIDEVIANLIRHDINARMKSLNVDVYYFGIFPNHVHIIHTINPRMPVCDLIQNIKGGSSHFVNSQKYTNIRFAWNPGPICFSLGSENHIKSAVANMKNHDDYHKHKSLQEEIVEYRKLYPEININVFKSI